MARTGVYSAFMVGTFLKPESFFMLISCYIRLMLIWIEFSTSSSTDFLSRATLF